MTPAEQRLTDHLASVCGWTPAHIKLGGVWSDVWREDGEFLVRVSDFDPLHDPRDCAIVMEAWWNRSGQENRLTIFPEFPKDKGITVFWSTNGSGNRTNAKSWTEAVCEAIGRATKFDGEKL